MDRIPALLVAAGLLAGCAGRHHSGGRWTESMAGPADGLHVGKPRLVPPAPGECVGRFEVTFVNGGRETVRVGSFSLLQDGEEIDVMGVGPPFGSGWPEFATFDAEDEVDEIAPGDSRTLSRGLVRCNGGTGSTVRMQGVSFPPARAFGPLAITTSPLEVDSSRWPIPGMVEAEALRRALAEGHGLVVQIHSAAMPGGGVLTLAVDPEGRAHGDGYGRFPGRKDGEGRDGYRCAGTLSSGQREALHAAIVAAPFSAFRADPKWKDMDDGHPVRLLVTCGPLAFVAGSQEDDFSHAGLGPLLEHLRVLSGELPLVEKKR